MTELAKSGEATYWAAEGEVAEVEAAEGEVAEVEATKAEETEGEVTGGGARQVKPPVQSCVHMRT